MSIKDLFELQKKNTVPVTDTNSSDIYLYAESYDNIAAKYRATQRFVPLSDFSDPKNFVKFGSAENYYSSSITNILNEFPYDGSKKELNEYLEKCTYLELYLLDKRYPRYNGFITLSTNNYNFSGGKVGGYGNPTSKEYIYLFGGPHTASQGMIGNPLAETFDDANKYQTDVYATASRLPDGRTGTRTNNLLINPSYGATVEFWLKKSGYSTTSNEKEVIFDLWNSEVSSSSGYGRLLLGLTGSADGLSTFYFEMSSGSVSINQTISITNFTTSSLSDNTWRHYAFTFQNTGSDLAVKAYVNGSREYLSTFAGKAMNTVDGAMVASIGALKTSPSGSTYHGINMTGYGKLSASLDEFRYWKSVRDEKEISFYYRTQVGGGTNTDISNTELGVYYKFNEGIVGDTSIDSTVLDYSGRISNGIWYGYPGTSARSTGSAMVLSNATNYEYLDPVIRETHPSVVSLREELLASGSEHDSQNISSLYGSMPSWIIDEDRATDSEGTYNGNLFNLTQIMAYQLDEMYLSIDSLNKLKNKEYISASYGKPIPFSSELLANQGFVSPNIFENAKLYEKILNTDSQKVFEEELTDIKNQVYQNVYNNLVYIYKSKGTQKSFRNLIRNFGVDDDLVNISIYPNNTRYKYDNRYDFPSIGKKFVNFHNPAYFDASIHHTPGNNSYVSGNLTTFNLREVGFTTETEAIFPKKPKFADAGYFFTLHTTSSIVGFHQANTAAPTDFTFPANETNLKVYSSRTNTESVDASFILTGTIGGTTNVYLTSSIFYSVYDNKKWNFAITLRPDKFLHAEGITGSVSGTYTLEFYGVNKELDIVIDSFYLTQSLTYDQGKTLSSTPKRFYAGAHRNNITGSADVKTDVRIGSLRHWLYPLDSDTIDFHAQNPISYGMPNAARNAFLNQSVVSGTYVPQIETLALHWDFASVTGSDTSGEFSVFDISSGSYSKSLFGQISDITNVIYSGKASNFPASDSTVISKEYINFAEQSLPDEINSYDLIQTPATDDETFTKEILPVNYYFSFEKSPFRNVSKDMLNMFSSLKELNNLYHQPAQRYREEHKELNNLRELYFRKIGNIIDVDRYFSYYRWIDQSLSEMLRQLVPITADAGDRVTNVIESHILERNHYKYNYPLLKYKNRNYEGRVFGIAEMLYPWNRGYHPIANVENENCYWWNRRAERNGTVITSGNSVIDAQRENIRRTVTTHTSGSGPLLAKPDGTAYYGSDYSVRRFTQLYNFDMSLDSKFSQVVEQVLFVGLNAPKGFVTKVWKAIVASLSGATLVLDNFEEQEDCKDISTIKLLEPVKTPIELKKVRMKFRATFGTTQIGAYSVLPFTFMSASSGVPNTGYQAQLIAGFGTGKRFDIVGHHSDVYDMDFEVPMQGPFTERYVGGHAHRHVELNQYDSNTRPEAYDMNLTSGIITITNRDITKPRTTVSRDGMAKRPVNLANIAHSTGSTSTVAGNYNLALDIVSTTGRSENDLSFNDTPFNASTVGSWAVSGTSDYTKLARTTNKNVIVQRFSAPGDPATMGDNLGGPGLDAAHGEYSVYNALPFRNLSVRLPLRTFLTTRSEINGLTSGSIPVVADYSGTASFHGVYRNKLGVLEQTDSSYFSSSISDNYFVQHQIPRNDLHYSWITDAAITYNSFPVTTAGEVPSGFVAVDGKYSSSLGVNSAITFVTASSIVSYATTSTGKNVFGFIDGVTTGYSVVANSQLRTGFNGMTTNIVDPFDLDTMTLGLDTTASVNNYINPSLVPTSINTNNAYILNSIIATRGGKFAKSSWYQVRHGDKKYIKKLKSTNTISHTVDDVELLTTVISDTLGTQIIKKLPKTYTFIEPCVELDNKPFSMLFTAGSDNTNLIINLSVNNEVSHFTNEQLNSILNIRNENSDKVKQIRSFLESNKNIDLRNVLFADMVYPSSAYQSLDIIRKRINFDNNFWRSSRTDRNIKGFATKKAMVTNGSLTAISQSSWALDASTNFETVSSLTFGITNAQGADYREGILQNNYYLVHTGTTDSKASLRLAPLYSRKHFLGSAFSFTPTLSVTNTTTGSLGNLGSFPDAYPLGNATIFGGVTKWEANNKSGYFNNNGEFVEQPTDPFYDTYGGFAEDLRPHNQSYSILPEFRISNFIDYYVNKKQGNFLSENLGMFDIFGVCAITSSATVASSSLDTDFYKVYATSDLFENLEETLNELKGIVEPESIKLKFKGLKKFIPYDGFYPSERTVDLAFQFSKSYGSFIQSRGSDTGSLTSGADNIKLRPLYTPLFAPGILYNTIKSGIAVDYPIYTASFDKVQIQNADLTGAPGTPSETVASTGSYTEYYLLGTGSGGMNGFDLRIPFEAIYDPKSYLKDVRFVDMEPHPSASLVLSASWDGNGDDLYELMANNFLAEVVDFYLDKGEMASLVSDPQSKFTGFTPGTYYSMRVRLRRSTNVPRIFSNNYPTPQNSFTQTDLRESLTMYSRPSAFGPPMAARKYVDTGSYTSSARPDSLFAYDLAFTPPYYDGEAWADIIFTASQTTHTLDDIFGDSRVVCWRVDSGSDWVRGNLYDNHPYGEYANRFAMQLTSSINLFSKVPVKSVDFDANGNPTTIKEDKSSNDHIWVIQPKFETPVLNFTSSIGTQSLTLPTVASESVAVGMWHQFGVVPDSPDKGIFLEVSPIENVWINNRLKESMPTAIKNIYGASSQMASLLDIVKFRKKSTRVGDIGKSKTVYEAVVAVPFVESQGKRKFFELNRPVAVEARKMADNPSYKPSIPVEPGKSLIDLYRKMRKYVFPPTFDFYNYEENDLNYAPISMYVFEFSHTFSQNDLVKMWQNIAPEIGNKVEFSESTISHDLSGYEILDAFRATEGNANANLKWLVFKVKQRAKTNFEDKQLGKRSNPDPRFTSFRTQVGNRSNAVQERYSYNWPYDNFSLIEFGKMDFEVIAKPSIPIGGLVGQGIGITGIGVNPNISSTTTVAVAPTAPSVQNTTLLTPTSAQVPQQFQTTTNQTIGQTTQPNITLTPKTRTR
jgi:hypothetical protein